MTRLQVDALMLFYMFCILMEEFGRRLMLPRPRRSAPIRDAIFGLLSLTLLVLYFGYDLIDHLSRPPQPAPAWQAFTAVGLFLLSAFAAGARFAKRLRGRV